VKVIKVGSGDNERTRKVVDLKKQIDSNEAITMW
jgi:hypothetical protein